MKRGIVKTNLVILALAGFFLSTWTVHSNVLFQMQHKINHSQQNKDGSYTHFLSVELTNHSTVDLSSVQLIASTDPEKHPVISTKPLGIKLLPATETATLNWSVRSFATAESWNQYPVITFTGSARDSEQNLVSLIIVSEKNSG